MKPGEFLHLALTELREAVRHGASPGAGACHAIIWYGYEFEDFAPSPVFPPTLKVALNRFKELYMQWPSFSGNPEHPVRAPRSGRLRRSMFNRAREEYHRHIGDGLWAGDYGRLRMEMLDFVIDCLEKELT